MRTRFTCDEFTVDISGLSISWTEENSWFQEDFFLVSSFPFDLPYDRVEFLKNLRSFNSIPETVFQGMLEDMGRLEPAEFEIEEAGPEGMTVTIRYGLEALPNWEKKLSDIEMDVVNTDGIGMPGVAAAAIDKTYPEVNYNFPAVHSEYYYGMTDFEGWEGVLNKRVNGSFVANYYDPGTKIVNKNILYPFPYHLYVLRKVIEDAGYTLHGDVLNDQDLKDVMILSGKNIIEFEGLPRPFDFDLELGDRINGEHPEFDPGYWIGQQTRQFYAEQELNVRGRFKINGEIWKFMHTVIIKLNGDVVFSWNHDMPRTFYFDFTTDTDSNELSIWAVIYLPTAISPLVHTVVKTLELHDEYGESIPLVANFANPRLNEKLPDMTVGEFVKFHKRLKNYDFDLREGNEIWMNLIKNEVKEKSPVNIDEYNHRHVSRRFEQSKSFLLKYDVENEEYPFDQVYADKSGYFINDFEKAENTEEITIPGIPLPLDTITSPYDPDTNPGGSPADITTAVQISDDATKMMLVRYDGLNDGENWAKPLDGLNPVTLYLDFWSQWLTFLVHAVYFIFSLRDLPGRLQKVTRKSKLFAYNNFMFVKSLNRQREGEIEEVEVEAASTKV